MLLNTLYLLAKIVIAPVKFIILLELIDYLLER